MTKVIPRKVVTSIPELGGNWIKGSPVLSHLVNALSTLFPIGESFFIASVKPFINDIKDDDLRTAVICFIEQERNHSAVHNMLNRGLEKYNMKKRYKSHDSLSKKALKLYSSEFILANTAGLEHLTATISYVFIKENHLKEGNPQIAGLFYWHFLEELEHKSVAFQLFQEVDGNQWKLYLAMVLRTFHLYGVTISRMLHFLYKDGMLFRIDTLKEIFRLHFSHKGVLRKCLPLIIEFFKTNFHPDQRDDSKLILDMEMKLKGVFTKSQTQIG